MLPLFLVLARQRVEFELRVDHLVVFEKLADAMLEQLRQAVVEPHAFDLDTPNRTWPGARGCGADAGYREVCKDAAGEIDFQIHVLPHRNLNEKESHARVEQRTMKDREHQHQQPQPAQRAPEAPAFGRRWGGQLLRFLHWAPTLPSPVRCARRRKVVRDKTLPLESAR